jgi:hypothetical protein
MTNKMNQYWELQEVTSIFKRHMKTRKQRARNAFKTRGIRIGIRV